MSKFIKNCAAFLLCAILMFSLCSTALAAVEITSQPKSVTVANGETAEVTVKATGDGLTYTWYYAAKGSSSFKKTSSFTGPTYSVTMNADRDGRQVYCVVKDASGEKATTNKVSLNMEKTPLEITSQPKSVTVGSGETAEVTVKATGNGLKYTWYYAAKGSSSFKKTSSFTGPSYSVTMNADRDGRQVYCVVKDAYGETMKTSVVSLNMEKTPLQITAQPESVTVANGETAKVTVKAVGDGLKYTWYYAAKGSSSFKKTSSFTGPSYSIAMNADRDGRQVYCVVKDAYGETFKTPVVSLNMVKTPLEIIAVPESVTVANGETAEVTVKATGDGLKYTWYYAAKNSSSFTKTSSFTGPSYSIAMNADRDGRQVYCVVKDAYGETFKTPVVSLNMVKTPLEIIAVPESVTVANGETAEVTVKATGDGLKYTWYYAAKNSSSFTKTTSFTGPSYSIAMSAARDGRQVYCVVKDAYGETFKTPVVSLNMVKTPLEITAEPESVTVANGETAKVTVEATGDGLKYTWYYAEKGSSTFKKTTAFTGPSYSIAMSATRDGRQVYCVVKDAYGDTLETPVVTLNMVKTPLEITSQPKNVRVAEGETAEVTVEATGDGLKYTWYYAEKGSSTFKKTTAFTGPSYSIAMSATRDGRQVYCVVKDAYGDTVETEIVTLSMSKLEITKNIPLGCYYLNHYPFTFTAEAEGDDVTYAWYSAAPGSDDFVLVSEETTYSLTMSPELEGTRIYFIATDAYGATAQSRICLLNLRLDLAITAQPVSVSVLEGEEAVVSFQATGNDLTYEWYYADPGSTVFKKTSSFTSNEYKVTMTEARNGRQVYCVITDMFRGTVQTDTVTLSIRPPLAFTENISKGIRLPDGMPHTFTVKAEGVDVTYAWYSAAPESDTFELVGEGDSYTTSVTPETYGTRIYCVATDAYGDTVQSNICPLMVRYEVEIVTQPVSVAVPEGEEAVITFEATGDELKYEWYYAAPGSTEFKKTDSFTSNEYRVTMNEDRNGRQVYCVVTDMYRNSVQTDTVTMIIKTPFEFESAEDGSIVITGYTEDDADVVVPSKIGNVPVTAIADSAFADNTVLTSITLPKTVTSIGDSAFENCTSLETVTLSDNVETIGVAAFKNCTSLASMQIRN